MQLNLSRAMNAHMTSRLSIGSCYTSNNSYTPILEIQCLSNMRIIDVCRDYDSGSLDVVSCPDHPYHHDLDLCHGFDSCL